MEYGSSIHKWHTLSASGVSVLKLNAKWGKAEYIFFLKIKELQIILKYLIFIETF